MNKALVLVMLAVIGFGGCSHFKITAAMCDNINPEQGQIPQECRDYDKEKAAKAFDKVHDKNKVSHKDIEFDAEKNGE